jgi:hypothetical protein
VTVLLYVPLSFRVVVSVIHYILCIDAVTVLLYVPLSSRVVVSVIYYILCIDAVMYNTDYHSEGQRNTQ